MSSDGKETLSSPQLRKRAPPPPPPRRFQPPSITAAPTPLGSSTQPAVRLAVFSSFLMNDIPLGTSRVKLSRFLMSRSATGGSLGHVQIGTTISNSRLDDELSVATIEFSDTPSWLQDTDPRDFPKHTSLGTIWRWVDRNAVDEHGRTAFIRAVIEFGGQMGVGSNSHLGLCYAEMLAEFSDTNVNSQDDQGRTALHWACAMGLPAMVMLCLSVAECEIGLQDKDNLTAFDISHQSGNDGISSLFYSSILEMEDQHPQAALLRVLTVTADPDYGNDKPIFPGEAIFDPIEDRNSPLVIALLNRGVDLTTTNKDGNTALHVAAAQAENAEIVTRLLEAGSDINALTNAGATPLHCAARSGDVETVQILLDWKADVYAKDNLGQTALQLAEAKQRLHHVLLLKRVEEMDQRVELDPLAQHGPEEVLVENPGEPEIGFIELRDNEGLTPLLRAVLDEDLKKVEILLAQGANPKATDNFSRTALHLAAAAGHTETVQALLVGGAQIDATDDYNKTALHMAAENGHKETVKVLLVSGAQIDATDYDNKTALRMAATNGHTETVKALLVGGAHIDSPGFHGRIALHLAAENGRIETVKALLVKGAQINTTDNYNNTGLHMAAGNGHTETVKALLVGGAHIDKPGFHGRTALHIAAENGHKGAVKVLLVGGAQIDATNDYNKTALHMAAENGHTETVKALLVSGAQIDATDYYNKTALHMAATNRHTKTVKALLIGGAKIDARSQSGKTAYQLASSNNDRVLMQLLADYGAQTTSIGRFRSEIINKILRKDQS